MNSGQNFSQFKDQEAAVVVAQPSLVSLRDEEVRIISLPPTVNVASPACL